MQREAKAKTVVKACAKGAAVAAAVKKAAKAEGSTEFEAKAKPAAAGVTGKAAAETQAKAKAVGEAAKAKAEAKAKAKEAAAGAAEATAVKDAVEAAAKAESDAAIGKAETTQKNAAWLQFREIVKKNACGFDLNELSNKAINRFWARGIVCRIFFSCRDCKQKSSGCGRQLPPLSNIASSAGAYRVIGMCGPSFEKDSQHYEACARLIATHFDALEGEPW